MNLLTDTRQYLYFKCFYLIWHPKSPRPSATCRTTRFNKGSLNGRLRTCENLPPFPLTERLNIFISILAVSFTNNSDADSDLFVAISNKEFALLLKCLCFTPLRNLTQCPNMSFIQIVTQVEM
ncbi:hypothetical protein ACOME3_007296 [Neoechinorhynchus agilis]